MPLTLAEDLMTTPNGTVSAHFDGSTLKVFIDPDHDQADWMAAARWIRGSCPGAGSQAVSSWDNGTEILEIPVTRFSQDAPGR